MKINEVITEDVYPRPLTPSFLKGVAKAIVPGTVDSWDKTKNAYPMPWQTPIPATGNNAQPKLPSVITTPDGIKVKKDPVNNKWIRQDDNTEVTDPREIQRLEQLAKNAKQVNIARGIQTR